MMLLLVAAVPPSAAAGAGSLGFVAAMGGRFFPAIC